MAKKRNKRWTAKKLVAFGIPAVLIPGILLAITLGWNPKDLVRDRNYYKNTNVFPQSGIVDSVFDGDTFTLQNGRSVRLIGVNAPDRGDEKYAASRDQLAKILEGKRVYLEYDRYQDDKYGRVLAWVWIDCETKPTFLPPDYMHLTYNTSREGLKDNPKGCKKGTLVNEAMVDASLAEAVRYKEQGELKYEKRLIEQ